MSAGKSPSVSITLQMLFLAKKDGGRILLGLQTTYIIAKLAVFQEPCLIRKYFIVLTMFSKTQRLAETGPKMTDV
jgi:hypothetical protein